jgi:hypothetical protein
VTLTLAALLAATLCTWKPAATGNPLDRFFSAAKVECQEAKAGSVARDRVNVFVRDADRIGIDVGLTNRIDDATLQRMIERARPSARVKVNGLADGDALYAYLPETAVAIPLVVSDGVALVPAETMLVVISASPKGSITGVSAPSRSDTPDITLNKRALVGWLQAKVPKTGAPKSPPIVMLDGKQKPDAALKLEASPLIIFRAVSDGKHELTLRGDSWKTQTVALEAKDITTMKAPLVATPSRNLTVRWTLLNDPATLAPKEEACDVPAAKITGPMTMTLLDCPGMQPNAWYMSVDHRKCRDAEKVTLPDDQRHGRTELHDLASGPYLLKFTRDKLPDLWQSIVVPDDRDGDIAANVEYFRLFGTITRGGKPVRANLAVSGGEAVSDADGRYELTVAEPRIGNMMKLIPCDTNEEYEHIVDERPPANQRFDIDIPENVLIVDVVDDKDGNPIPDAKIGFGILENGEGGDDGGAWYAGDIGKTDEKGRYVLKQTAKKYRVHVCARRDDYENKCADQFRFEDQAEVALKFALKKLELRKGEVHVAGAIEAGAIIWTTRDGRRTEHANVNKDGTFTYTTAHAPGEIVAFLSSSHPFYAFLQPLINEGQLFAFTLPPAPARTFEVSLDESASGEVAFLSLMLGDLVLPAEVLNQYGMRHGSHLSVRRGQTTFIRDILETAPLSVVSIPLSFLEMNNKLTRPDLALIPGAATFHYRLGNESHITVNDH